MKLVIEIPEEDYNNIEPFLNGETIKGGFNLFKALEIIKNGKPLPKGHWIIDKERLGYYISKCSACGHLFHGNDILIYRPKYCASCGAKMEGAE